MLSLTREIGEQIVIQVGDVPIIISIAKGKRDKQRRLIIEAPRQARIRRREIVDPDEWQELLAAAGEGHAAKRRTGSDLKPLQRGNVTC